MSDLVLSGEKLMALYRKGYREWNMVMCEDGRYFRHVIDFSDTDIGDANKYPIVNFVNYIFPTNSLIFAGITFEQTNTRNGAPAISFWGAKFNGAVDFKGVTFKGDVFFLECKI